MKTALLTDIADVKLGFLPRKALEENAPGTMRLIQMRDVSDSGHINYSAATPIHLESDDLSRFEIKTGDVILSNRGDTPHAVLIENPPPHTLASAHFFILQVRDESVLPAFLAWVLNQQKTQTHFKRNLVGTSLQVLNKSVLEELTLAIPPLATQEKIVHLNTLNQHHHNLTQALQSKMDLLVTLTIQGAKP